MNVFTRAAVVVTVVLAFWLPSTHAATTCKEVAKSPCFSCTAVGSRCLAVGEDVIEEVPCFDGQVCVETNGNGECVDAAGTNCECEPFTTGCDLYDPEAVTMCFIDRTSTAMPLFTPNFVQSCPSGEACSDGKCPSQAPTTTTTTPTTTTSTTTTTPTTTTTTTPTTTTTTTPTTTTTTIPTTTPTTPTTTTTSTTTTPTTTTTNKPATCTAASANMRFPHESDCKKYYTCRETTRRNYSYVTSTCPSVYVFNPTTKYCDFPANVPTCQTASRRANWRHRGALNF